MAATTTLKRWIICAASLCGLAALLLAAQAITVRGSPAFSAQVFLPLVTHTNNTISGHIADEANFPLAHVSVSTDQGQVAITDAQGNFQLVGLSDGLYTLIPSKDGFTFIPETRTVSGQNSSQGQDFVAYMAAPCYNEIANGGFEYTAAWAIVDTAYPAAYATDRWRSGIRSMFAGITDSGDNRYSYSDFRQDVSIPENPDSATLSFWLYSQSSETSTTLSQLPSGGALTDAELSDDVQYLLVLNTSYQIVETLVWQRSDTQAWTHLTFDLLPFAGSTIYLQFGTYNDGADGITALYADDVALEICPHTSAYSISGRVATAGNSPVAGVSLATNTGRTATTDANGNYQLVNLPSGSYILTPTKSTYVFDPVNRTVSTPPNSSGQDFTASIPPNCYEEVSNGSFETNSAWNLPITAYPAGYATEHTRTGVRSIRTGIVNPDHNRYSYSPTNQMVYIPLGVPKATLRFWLYPGSGEAAEKLVTERPRTPAFGNGMLAEDVQYSLILDQNGNWINTLVWQLSNSQAWTYYEFDLSQYAGTYIQLHFGSYNDGANGVTFMYVDDVSLEICPTAAASTSANNPQP